MPGLSPRNPPARRRQSSSRLRILQRRIPQAPHPIRPLRKRILPRRIESLPTTISPWAPIFLLLRARRLKQLNRCDRTCFNDVKKQAISFGYITAFPRSTREEMDDRLANDIQELQNDLKWQNLLLGLISAHVGYCATRQKSPPLDNSPSHTPTRAEILEEEARASQPRQAPTSNYGAAGSAVMSYRFSSRPDPLKASLMVHQYMDEVHRDCPLSQSTADTDDDQDP